MAGHHPPQSKTDARAHPTEEAEPNTHHGHRNVRIVTGIVILAGGLIHLQDWAELLRNVPKIGPLSVFNAAVSVVAAALFVRRGWLGIVAAIVLSVGTLAGFLLARYSTLLEYSENTVRLWTSNRN